MEMAAVPYMELRNAKSTKRRQSGWYTAAEVGTHCTIADCWISIQGIVYDLTSLLPKNPEFLNELIVRNAGKDVSHWFEPRSFLTDELQVVMYFHPVMRINTFYTPLGRFTHIPPLDPRTDYAMDYEKPWWQDPAYIIGRLSYQTRLIRIKNVLLDHTYTMEVPCEESISEILIRYADNNAHAMSYEWKAILDFKSKAFSLLDMGQCLSDNGVINESKDFGEAGMELDFLIPVLHVHYTDDLTVA
ncbi:unnamed protein product [Sphagnum tenellum]